MITATTMRAVCEPLRRVVELATELSVLHCDALYPDRRSPTREFDPVPRLSWRSDIADTGNKNACTDTRSRTRGPVAPTRTAQSSRAAIRDHAVLVASDSEKKWKCDATRKV